MLLRRCVACVTMQESNDVKQMLQLCSGVLGMCRAAQRRAGRAGGAVAAGRAERLVAVVAQQRGRLCREQRKTFPFLPDSPEFV